MKARLTRLTLLQILRIPLAVIAGSTLTDEQELPVPVEPQILVDECTHCGWKEIGCVCPNRSSWSDDGVVGILEGK